MSDFFEWSLKLSLFDVQNKVSFFIAMGSKKTWQIAVRTIPWDYHWTKQSFENPRHISVTTPLLFQTHLSVVICWWMSRYRTPKFWIKNRTSFSKLHSVSYITKIRLFVILLFGFDAKAAIERSSWNRRNNTYAIFVRSFLQKYFQKPTSRKKIR